MLPISDNADKDSYPHDRNVTDDLCSLIKLCFAFISYFKKCLNQKKMHNRHRPKREKQVIDHSTGGKN